MVKQNIKIMTCIIMTFIASLAVAEDMSLDSWMLLHDNIQDSSLQLETSLKPTEQGNQSPQLNQESVDLSQIEKPVRVLIDVRSDHSDGAHDFKTLVGLAKARHIQALAFTEHDRYSIRFGLDPVPHIFGYSQEHPSLYETGLEKFFSDLNTIQKQSDLTLFSGTESTPGYYWQGIPFKNLSLHEAERHIITLGAKTPEQVEGLTSYDLRHGYGNKELSLMFWCLFIFSFIFILFRKRKRGIALLLAGSFIAFITTWLMKADINPDEDFINSAHEQGLIAIWTHPGTLSGARDGPMGVFLNTPPYNEVVFQSSKADAFAAVYGDTDKNTIPSGLWDQYMMDYMAGYRPKPIWAVAAGDYHEEGHANEYLGNFPMDVWAKSAQEDDILLALKKGRMVAWHMRKQQNIAVKALYMDYTDPTSGAKERLLAGGEAAVTKDVRVVVALRELGSPQEFHNLKGQWIVDGKVVAHVSLSTDESIPVFASTLNLPIGRHVIRFQIPAQQGIRLEANPFLVQVRK